MRKFGQLCKAAASLFTVYPPLQIGLFSPSSFTATVISLHSCLFIPSVTYSTDIESVSAAMDAELNGPFDVDWDGFINFPQTPDLAAQSPFNLEQGPGLYADQEDPFINTGLESMLDQSLVQPKHLLMPPTRPQPCQMPESQAESFSPAFVGSRTHNTVPAGLEEIKARSRTWRSGGRANVGLQQVFKSQNFKPTVKRAGLQRDPGKMICIQCKIKKVKVREWKCCWQNTDLVSVLWIPSL